MERGKQRCKNTFKDFCLSPDKPVFLRTVFVTHRFGALATVSVLWNPASQVTADWIQGRLCLQAGPITVFLLGMYRWDSLYLVSLLIVEERRNKCEKSRAVITYHSWGEASLQIIKSGEVTVGEIKKYDRQPQLTIWTFNSWFQLTKRLSSIPCISVLWLSLYSHKKFLFLA